MKLKISSAVSLPAEAVTSTMAILAKKGAGKTYTGSVIAEEMLDNGIQVVIIDATGAWYGLKSSADGHGPGYPVAILGGDRADVPLEHTAGEVTAEAIVEGGFSCILDLSGFSKSKVFQFMAPFLATLYLRNKHAMHLFVDEADIYAPQKTWGSEDAKCLGAMQDVVRRGRIKGIGITMITQRAQVLNKDVLTSTDILFALRMNHQLDLKAIREWVNAKADPALAAEMESSLPSLPTGDAWVWAPELDIFARTTVRKRKTFDSSATPKPGQRKQVPKVFAPIDLEKLGERIKATVAEKQANDPRALKARILELERGALNNDGLAGKALADLRQQASEAELRIERMRNYAQEVIGEAKACVDNLQANASELLDSIKDARGRMEELGKRKPREDGIQIPTAPPLMPAKLKPQSEWPMPVGHAIPLGPEAKLTHANGAVTGSMMKILEATAKLEKLGVSPVSRQQVAMLAGYSHVRSSGFRVPLSAAIKAGYVEGGEVGALVLTGHGRQVTAHIAAPATTSELHQQIFDILGAAETKMLRVLIESYPLPVTREKLAETCGYSHVRSSGFRVPLSRLLRLGLAEAPATGEVAGSDLLFLDAK
jgi:hypothetical protein